MMEVRATGAPTINPLDERNFKVLKTGASATNAQNYNFTLATTPTANALVIVTVLSQKSGGSGGATGLSTSFGITWTKVGSTQSSGDFALTQWQGLNAAPSGTTIQVAHAATQDSCGVLAVQCTGVNTSTPVGVNGQGAAASTTLTLTPSGGTARNLFFVGWGMDVNMGGSSAPWPGFVPGAGSSTGVTPSVQDGVNDTPANVGLVFTTHQYGNEISIAFTKSTAGRILGSAVEVVAA
jgi:hypothetical protein